MMESCKVTKETEMKIKILVGLPDWYKFSCIGSCKRRKRFQKMITPEIF